MHASNYIYHHGDLELHGYLAHETPMNKPRPAVLVVHDWTGRNEFAEEKARQLAGLGYIGFAVDMYGSGRQGETIEDKKALMTPLINDRHTLIQRLQAALDVLYHMDEVDNHRIAAIGFCFGGLCVLDLARGGASILGVVSFHGLLHPPETVFEASIKAKVLVLHGYDDPMVPPEQVHEFCEEMTKADVDWQVDMYGHTKHAFSNPNAHDTTLGTIYNPQAERRSWEAMTGFLQELFDGA